MTAATHPLTLQMDDDTSARVTRLAHARHCTPDTLIQQAISQYLEQEEKRELFRQDTLQAWQEYRHTGLHVSADEADSWLAELEQGNDIKPPECHS